MLSILRRIKYNLVNKINATKYKNSRKTFCIGLNKTGTTSVKAAWKEHGIYVASEESAKHLFDSWKINDFAEIVDFCKSAEAFQDSPFSFPETYKHLDRAFVNSKFILTIRDDAEEWYRSLIKFHSKLWGKGKIPTKEDLLNAVNNTKGRPFFVNQAVFKTPEDDPYNKEILLKFYECYVSDIKQYFSDRPDDLLIINLKSKTSYRKFCEFQNLPVIRDDFPWENKT